MKLALASCLRTCLRICLCTCLCLASAARAAGAPDEDRVSRLIRADIGPLMHRYRIPGVAVAVTLNGQRYFQNLGVASLQNQRPVTNQTLFELGSISKTFTATLAAYAEVSGKLSLDDDVATYLPRLRGTRFGLVTLVNLGTHTSGDLPLQVPDDIPDNDHVLEYLSQWHPRFAPGTHRAYTNIGIGVLGIIVARQLNESFDDALEKDLLPKLGLAHSFVQVPPEHMDDYAQGYTVEGAPIRLNPAALSSETYGVKSTTLDMVRFLEVNMEPTLVDEPLREAVARTHKGYFQAGPMTQDLIWEQYPVPLRLHRLLAGNSEAMIFEPTVARRLDPPLAPRSDVLIDKTGSTNGFAAYVAFIPERHLGIVILANKSFPIAERVTAAYRILSRLGESPRAGPKRHPPKFAGDKVAQH